MERKGGKKMKRIKVVLEFNEIECGEMNIDNLNELLHTTTATKKEALKILYLKELPKNETYLSFNEVVEWIRGINSKLIDLIEAKKEAKHK